MHIRRRNNEHLRIKRNNRKAKTSDNFSSLFGTPFKLVLIWATIMMLDFFTDFRFEFIYSCWLFIRTVVDSFRYQGLAFALFFTLIAMMSDVICYFLVPTTLVYLLGSSFVWIQLIWQSDRGFYAPTIVLCFIFVYVEIAVRLRDPKHLPIGIDICRPFATHCVGYPAVTFGFVLKTMVSHHFRQRRQRSVEAQNATFFALLEEALPKELRQYLKSGDSLEQIQNVNNPNEAQAVSPITHPTLPSTNRSLTAKDKLSSGSSVNRKQAMNPSNSLKTPSSASQEPFRPLLSDSADLSNGYAHHNEPILSGLQPEGSITNVSLEGDTVDKSEESIPPWSGTDALDFEIAFDENSSVRETVDVDLHQSTMQTSQVPSSVGSATSISSCSSTCSSSSSSSIFVAGPSSRSTLTSPGMRPGECRLPVGVVNSVGSLSMTKPVVSTAIVAASSTNSKCAGEGKPPPVLSSSKNSNKDEYTLKLEVELKQLRTELQSLRGLEVDLRTQVQQLTAAERTFRSESSQLRQESETLQTKMVQLTQRLETDQANLRSAEERLLEERKQRMALEQKLAARQQNNVKTNKELTSGDVASPNKSPGGKVSGTKACPTSPSGTNNSSPNLPFTPPSPTTTTFTQTTIVCTAGDSCASRVKELETELVTLKREIADREAQLSSLKESRAAHGANGSDLTPGKKGSISNRNQETEREELLTQLTHLQEENQRMTDTLKEEDKMKQELLTAYHASLKEITELNASLTKKEFQIVELNMRLEYLTPHLCEYVNMLNVASKQMPNSATVDVTSDDQGTRGLFNSDSIYRHVNSGTMVTSKVQHGLRKSSVEDCGFLDRGLASTRSNGLNHNSVSGYYGSSVDYPTSTYSSNYGGTIGMRNLPRTMTTIDSTVSPSPMMNGVSRMQQTFSNRGFSSIGDSISTINQGFSTAPTNQTSFSLQPPQNSTAFAHYNPLHFEQPTYSQHNRYKSMYPNSVTRPLPVGSAAPTSSPTPFLVPPPGLMSSTLTQNLLHSVTSTSHPLSFASAHPPSRPLDVVVNSSGLVSSELLPSPECLEIEEQSAGPCVSSVNRLIESLSMLGSSSDSNLHTQSGRQGVTENFSVNLSPDIAYHSEAANLSQFNNTVRASQAFRARATFEDIDLVDPDELNFVNLSMLDSSLLKSDSSTSDTFNQLSTAGENQANSTNSEVDEFGSRNAII